MINLENEITLGFMPAIRGMRNPMNSWDKSDSLFIPNEYCDGDDEFELSKKCDGVAPLIRNADLSLMKSLISAGTDHRKFMRMIIVYVDITAPLYWWKEFDTYKVGTVANSCSTMHKIHTKEFTLDDFSCELLGDMATRCLEQTIHCLNYYRNLYNNGDDCTKAYDKDCWWQMIQLLPSSYNQRRTIMLNYEVIANIYKSRKNHKLDEWRKLCAWIETLPYMKELIINESSAEKN